MSRTFTGRFAGLAIIAGLVAAILLSAPPASAAIVDAHLALTGDTSTTMTVTFKEDAAVACTTALAYARPAGAVGGAAACDVASAPADCLQITLARTDATDVAGTGTVYSFFTGTFTGLAPGAGDDWFVSDRVTPAGVAPGTFTTARGGDTPYTAATYGEVHVDDGDDVTAFGASGPGNYSTPGLVGLWAADNVVWNQNVRPGAPARASRRRPRPLRAAAVRRQAHLEDPGARVLSAASAPLPRRPWVAGGGVARRRSAGASG